MWLIRPMTIDDHDAVIELLTVTPGVSLRDADSRDATDRYLKRNPNLSFVAADDSDPGKLIGCIMSGHDSRRGYLQHLAVLPAYRKQGVGRLLVNQCIDTLKRLGIYKSHIDVFTENEMGRQFWVRQGWELRDDIVRFSYVASGNANA